MSVFNGAAALPDTLQSVLKQEECDFDLIVVDDGSTDESAHILNQWATRDRRLRVVRQSNTGLTRALVHGCELAQGEFIARQDCGDISLPGRLARQWRYLHDHPEVALVACGSRYVGPHHEPLFVKAPAGMQLHAGLGSKAVDQIQGPSHHGATMFRTADYRRVGGYRPAFAVAQDVDLWLRLRELGNCIGDAFVGYEAKLEAGSISADRRAEQLRYAALAIECAKLRRQGLADDDLLASVPRAARGARRRSGRLARARFYYFIGSCLRLSDPASARRYFARAWREHPLYLKSLIRLALG